MNKLDRDGREPLDLLEELEEVLGIASYPMNWPIGMGKAFEGLYDLYNERLELYKGDERFAKIEDGDTLFANNPFYEQAKEDIELLTEAGNEFSEEAILAGELTPVFFGSALTNFGVQTFLDTFLKFAPEPHGHKKTDGELVVPYEKDFSGFVFKIQANMDTRQLMATRLILLTRISLVLFSKSKPTWTHVTVTVLPLFVSCLVNSSVV